MIEAITNAVVELARYVVIAYAIRNGRDVVIHWLDHGPTVLKGTAETQILDQARTAGIDLRQLAERAQ